MKKALVFIATLLFFDVFSKYLTYTYIPQMRWMHVAYPYGGYGIFQDVLGGLSISINHVQNKGAAWGLFSGYSDQLLLCRMVIILALLLYTAMFIHNPFQKKLFFCVIAGAIGNVIDYFVYGSVIDMIHVNLWGYTFPLFNFADMYISLGIAALLFSPLFQRNHYKASY